MEHYPDYLERFNALRRAKTMLLVVNKGRSTHVIGNIVDIGRQAVKVEWWDDEKQEFVESIDDMLWYFVEGRGVGGGIHLSKWEWVYVLMPDLVDQRPMSNARWVKRPSK